jgi:ribosomal protein L11 methyltransferase
MDTIKLTFGHIDTETAEMLIAQLATLGFDGFEEQENALIAYVGEDEFEEMEVKAIATQYNIRFYKEVIVPKNWNAEWERDFQPVVVGDFCTVRADFHNMEVGTTYEIVVTPKMSFGTGHHATTQLMIKHMENLDFAAKKVLDFGTGTGVLAILAEKLGAADVLAIDNDEWSVDNSKENLGRNSCTKCRIALGSLEITGGEEYDVILANINRNILLHYMPMLYAGVRTGGHILMSGLMPGDATDIIAAAENAGFTHLEKEELNNWIVLLFNK